MLADVAHIADREDVRAELLLNLQIELLDHRRLKLRSFGYECEASNAGQVGYVGWDRSGQSHVDHAWCTYCRAVRILACESTLACLNLNRDGGLAVGAED